jgi:hypothetical protein
MSSSSGSTLDASLYWSGFLSKTSKAISSDLLFVSQKFVQVKETAGNRGSRKSLLLK